MSDILYIIIPAYNEEQNIGKVIREWYAVIEKYSADGKSRLVVINDGSKDNTYNVMQESAKVMPQLTILTKENEGHGATLLYGYAYALKSEADYIFQTDSDGQTLPEEFDAFWERRHEADAIIGNRKHRQDGVSRIIVTKVLKLVVLLTFGVNIPDVNTPFRLMKKECLKKYIGEVPPKFNLSNVLLTILFVKGKEKVLFIPITFRKRQGGVNSINMRKINKIGVAALRSFIIFGRKIKQKGDIL